MKAAGTLKKEMMKKMQNQKFGKQALFFSLTLNAFLLLFIFYFSFKKPIALTYDFPKSKKVSAHFISNVEEIEKLKALPTKKLIQALNDTTLFEQGYRRRDLSLSLLASKHFDIERALQKRPSMRHLRLSEGETLTLFPGLTDSDFEKISTFISEEKWPLTTQGLFLALKQNKKKDDSLIDAFTQSAEFNLVERLFLNTSPSLGKKILLPLIVESPFEVLESFVQKQKKELDLSPRARRGFLIDCMKGGSKLSALVLLRTDSRFVLEELDNDTLILLLTKLPYHHDLSRAFAKKLLTSLRSDRVLKVARLFLRKGEKEEEAVAVRPGPRPSVGELRPVFRENPIAAPAPSVHVVQKGETLNTIARRYHVSLEALYQYNHLQTQEIRERQTLKIPQRP